MVCHETTRPPWEPGCGLWFIFVNLLIFNEQEEVGITDGNPKLESVLLDLLNDPARQEEIRKASESLAIRDTGKRITDAIKAALGNNP